MTGYMIKYLDTTPHSALRNTYYRMNRNRSRSMFALFDTLDGAKRVLKRIPHREHAIILEFDMRPLTQWSPTEHFWEKPKGLIYIKGVSD